MRRLTSKVVNEPGCVGGSMYFMNDPMSDGQIHMRGGDDSIVLSKEATTSILNMARNPSLESQVEPHFQKKKKPRWQLEGNKNQNEFWFWFFFF